MRVLRGRVLRRMTSARPKSGTARAGCAFAVLLSLGTGDASAQPRERAARDLSTVETEVDQLLRSKVRKKALRSATFVEERIAEGEVQLQLGDPLGASIIFTDIVESHRAHRAFPDALFLLGESLFRAGDVYGARRRFREVVTRAEREPAFRARGAASVVRLIEIAIRTGDFREIEAHIARFDRASAGAVGGATAYYRGRYLFGKAVPPDRAQGAVIEDRRALGEARRAFESIDEASAFHAKARYHLGAISALERDLDQALAHFEAAAEAEGEGDEHREVTELARLGAARVLYEAGRLLDAADAYQAIPRSSAYFSRANYEIAWVFIALGDSIQAERALEVLGVADPESPLLAEGKVLRGNLLLRNGRYDAADAVFQAVREQFGPVVRELDALHGPDGGERARFQAMVRENLDRFDADLFLPEHVRDWAVVDVDFERALRVLRDLAEAKELLRDAESLVERLDGAIASTRPVALFSDLAAQGEKITVLRGKLVAILDALTEREARDSRAPAELAELRRRRREVRDRLGDQPVGETYLAAKRQDAAGELRAIERELREIEVTVAGNEARILATERFLATGDVDAETAGVVGTEVQNHRRAAREHRAALQDLARRIEVLKLGRGVGEEKIAEVNRLQRELVALVRAEIEITGGAREPGSAALVAKALALAARLETREREVDAVASQRVEEIRATVDEEVERLQAVTSELGAISGEAEEVVGAVAHQTFRAVRARFHELVVRADVGQIDVAWSQREERRRRLEALTRDRARELQALDAEFKEIMHDGQGAEGGRR